MGLIKKFGETSSRVIGAFGNSLSPGAGDYLEYILNKNVKPTNFLATLATFGIIGSAVPSIAGDYYELTRSKFYDKGAVVGLSSGINTKGEVPLGISVDWKISENYRLGPYGSLNLRKVSEEDYNTKVTEREKTLIGAGIYKIRTDEITDKTETFTLGEIGVELRGKPWKKRRGFFGREIRVVARAGIEFQKEKKETMGTSTIEYEKNGEELPEKYGTISDSLNDTRTKGFFSVGAGLEYDLLHNFSVKLLGKYTNKDLTGMLGLTYYIK